MLTGAVTMPKQPSKSPDAMSQPDTATKGNSRKAIIILVSLAVLFIAFMFIPLPLSTVIEWGARVANSPFSIALILVLMAAMMTAGLPGSVCFWLIAPFHPPLQATRSEERRVGTGCGSRG